MADEWLENAWIAEKTSKLDSAHVFTPGLIPTWLHCATIDFRHFQSPHKCRKWHKNYRGVIKTSKLDSAHSFNPRFDTSHNYIV